MDPNHMQGTTGCACCARELGPIEVHHGNAVYCSNACMHTATAGEPMWCKGVFGPVSAPLLIIDEVTELTEKQWKFLAAIPKPAGERVVHWTFEPKPTCAGPLATHGTPVLRWTINYPHGPQPFCDACYLEMEREWGDDTKSSDRLSGDEVNESTEPPARVGTVPQVFGLNVGIWASRGMR